MSATLKLVLFDVDGTLVDSQGDIVAAMTRAFAAVDAPLPERAKLLSIVGLSLDVAMPTLAPDQTEAALQKMIESYKTAYMELRAQVGVAQSSPLYPGAMDALRSLQAVPEFLLGIATGKSRRGLDKLIEGHALDGLFMTQQVADFHPSKPHPSMILQAMQDAGVEPADTVMVGDTSFDMEMARAAGVRGIGVNWGYHPPERLGDAHVVIDDYAELAPLLERIWSMPG
ncbi:HAD-IA family hydrolase [Sulfitobacter mediterraneus]|uniref:HAD-IA family hydrolase n=1 Tax=Sulfitobacter mediterraneus TaxID=83219 RepID=UPI00193A695B|nr:HAD-IA family hydrolase [Sulfitobacter mediterraneus]MBM1558712.1 HAD-IA family hydrolase [Sulfitobacter mediterraneus]MBM1570059.1 HAD-IA family hydrolase [Sulfitobacter mediterraneus]MBM1574016.1 HAD-IA family hydrolase [Sulfitobacter mediterraneus]MBM1577781.1 HAD-IA family hydrolase [Sulfitobacter mediterraneus]MBM1581701.1 HAD-IA family hydrolase [Sulfitobacter mediterraneus]